MLALLCLPAAPALAGDWTVAEIAGPAGAADILPMAVNAGGVVVGTARFSGRADRTAFVWQNGTMSELALGGATTSAAYDVNDRGVIVGFTSGGGEQTGATWSAATGALSSMAFNISGRYGSAAYAINEAGTISGYAGDVTYYDFNGRGEADFQYPALSGGGGWSRIPMPDIVTDRSVQIRGGYATQINESGMTLVANSPNHSGNTRISYGGGLATDPTLELVPGNQGLNDLGQVAGRGPGSTSGPFTARVWSSATGYVEVGAAQELSRANAINNLGWVVGRVGTQDYQLDTRQLGNAWLWRLDGGDSTPLATLGPAGWSYANAMDVNDDGVIVGVGAHGGRAMGFMMTPSGLAHRLSGTVYGPAGAPAGGVQVRIVNPAGAQVAAPVTGADGRYEVTLGRGDYDVTPVGAYRADALAGCREIVGSTCKLGLVRNRVVDFYGTDVRVPGPGPGPADRVGDRRGPDVRVPRTSRSATASRAGVVSFALGPFSEPVSGVLVLQTAASGRASAAAARGRGRGRARTARPVALGSRSFRAAAGRRVVVAVGLTRAAKALLRRGPISALAVLTVRDALGNATVVRYAVKIKAPGRRRR
jgi:probable HAF family extracellular repeat protein